MNDPCWSDGDRTIYPGDAWALADALPPASIDCLVTSPPYWGLRSYLKPDDPLKPLEFGSEPHPQQWVEKLVDLFVRLRPALKPTATVWVNLGDSYCGGPGHTAKGENLTGGVPHHSNADKSRLADGGQWLRPKQLLLLPHRFAIAMQDAGFLCRNDVIWVKPNGMPQSVRDRAANKHEHLFLFALQERYYFDLHGVRRPLAPASVERISQPTFDQQAGGPKDHGHGVNPNTSARKALENLKGRCGRNSRICQDRDPAHPEDRKREPEEERACHPAGANPGDVQTWASEPSGELHYAAFPSALPRFALTAGAPKLVCSACGQPLTPPERSAKIRYHGKQNLTEQKAIQADVRRVREVLRGAEPDELQPEMRERPGRAEETETPEAVRGVREADHGQGAHEVLQRELCDAVETEARQSAGVPLGRREWETDQLQGREDRRGGVCEGARPGPSLGSEDSLRDGTPTGDGSCSGPSVGGERVRPPQERGQGGQPDREPRTRGPESPSRPRHLPSLSEDLLPALSPCCYAPLIGGLVLDPFLGTGCTLAVAKELGLRGIGFELVPSYCDIAARTISTWKRPREALQAEAAGQTTLDFAVSMAAGGAA